MAEQVKTNKKPLVIGGIVGLLMIALGVCGGLMSGFMILEDGVLCNGVTINNISVSNMTVEKALEKIKDRCPEEAFNDINLVNGDKNWSVSPEEIDLHYDYEEAVQKAFKLGRQGSFLDKMKERYNVKKNGCDIHLDKKYDEAKLKKIMQAIADEVNVPPTPATFIIHNDNSISIKKEVNGQKVDIPKSMKLLNEILDTKTWNMSLAVDTDVPEITEKVLEERGIKMVIGSSSSTYSTGNGNRCYNISVAANAIDDTMIAPGEVFSFNGVVGERSAEAGYRTAGVIVNNEVVDGLGGGVCQVSSTLYNAVLKSNLQIVERTNHSRPVSYYPRGLDATVSYNYLDFKFKNNTDHYIVIKAAAGAGMVTVRIFGYEAPGKVTLENVTTSTISAGSRTVNDPNLPKGKIVVEKNALSGYRIDTYRTVNGNKEKVSSSFYAPVSGVTRVGTGAVKPAASSAGDQAAAAAPAATTQP